MLKKNRKVGSDSAGLRSAEKRRDINTIIVRHALTGSVAKIILERRGGRRWWGPAYSLLYNYDGFENGNQTWILANTVIIEKPDHSLIAKLVLVGSPLRERCRAVVGGSAPLNPSTWKTYEAKVAARGPAD